MWSSIIMFAAELGLFVLNKINASIETKKRFLEFVDKAMKKSGVQNVTMKDTYEKMLKDLENAKSKV